METSVNKSSKNPSISDSYKRISGGTPIISVGNSGASYKSKTQAALEKYNAERAVGLQKEKDEIIGQLGQAGYDKYMETKQKRIKDVELGLQGMGQKYNEYSDGYSQGKARQEATEKLKRYNQGYAEAQKKIYNY
jgi:hypothetical protein